MTGHAERPTPKPPTKTEVLGVHVLLKHIQFDVAEMIARIPDSARRLRMTEAHMFILIALDHLEAAAPTNNDNPHLG